MSKSKRNTIDPEKIIESYGADSVRLFILSDSPPEKDVQWSADGIESSYKFIQKLWTLNLNLISEMNENNQDDEDDKIQKYTNKFIKKMTHNLENFSYNIIIANIHEMHSFMSKQIKNKYTKKTLKENYEKILITMLPIIPHFVNECLQQLKIEMNLNWPEFDEQMSIDEYINFVVQINGKKRGILNTIRNLDEKDLINLIKKDKNLFKYLDKKEVKKTIFVKNKLINLII